MRATRIALLASRGVIAVGYFHRALIEAGFNPDIVANEKEEAAKDVAIWNERTNSSLPPLDWSPTQTFPLLSSKSSADFLRRYDLAVNGGCLEIIKEPALRAPRLGILNSHPGILPAYRGACAVEWAIYNGDAPGVTAHIMDEGIDTGPIVMTKTINPFQFRSYPELRTAVYRACFDLAAAAARELICGRIPTTQASLGKYWNPIPDDKMKVVLSKFVRNTHQPSSGFRPSKET